eukprot:3483469-Pyramimonas_sp.AAC.1
MQLGNGKHPPEMSLMWVVDEPPPPKPKLAGGHAPVAAAAADPHARCVPYSAFVAWSDPSPERREGRMVRLDKNQCAVYPTEARSKKRQYLSAH